VEEGTGCSSKLDKDVNGPAYNEARRAEPRQAHPGRRVLYVYCGWPVGRAAYLSHVQGTRAVVASARSKATAKQSICL
jgi:hypothetical protein